MKQEKYKIHSKLFQFCLNFHGLDPIRPLLANSLDATDNAGAMREEGHLLWVLYSCGGVWGVVGGVVSVWGGKFIVSLL